MSNALPPVDVKAALEALVRAFPSQTKPLEPNDPNYVEDLYSEGDVEKRDPVRVFATNLALTDSPSVSLFTGLIGSGKSTELRRLKDILLKDHNQHAFILNMSEFINLNAPIQITDLLISMVAALTEQVETLTGRNPITENSKLAAFFGFINSNVEPESLEANAEGKLPLLAKVAIKFKANLKSDPTFKSKVQNALAGHLNSVFVQAREATSELWTALGNKFQNDESFVLLLDSLEQLHDTDAQTSTVRSSLVLLYSQFLDQLHLPGFKIVYSVPPYLSNLLPGLAGRLGPGCRLTNVHVFQDRTRNPDDAGVGQMVEIVKRRVKQIGAVDALFAPQALQDLAVVSGGELRTFFTMIRAVAVFQLSGQQPALPIQLASVEWVKSQMRRSSGVMTDDVVARLKIIDTHHEPLASTQELLNALAEDLDTKRVMLYRNGSEWYGVNPLFWPDLVSNEKAS
jgi:hypothetical protein